MTPTLCDVGGSASGVNQLTTLVELAKHVHYLKPRPHMGVWDSLKLLLGSKPTSSVPKSTSLFTWFILP